MTKEEMQKILDEMPAGADVEEYIKKKNEPVVDVNIIKEEYGGVIPRWLICAQLLPSVRLRPGVAVKE